MYGYFTEKDSTDSFYTDLACERRRANTDVEGVEYKREISVGGNWERIKITSEPGADLIGRPMGVYNTLEVARMDLLDDEAITDAAGEIANELCYIFDISDIFPGRILIAGLGNPALTPDSIGCESARLVKPTMHIKEFDRAFFNALSCTEIAVCTPGVNATSGLDAAVFIRGICNEIAPDAVIAIDSLSSRSVKRLGTTVQICNTGITPGSGLGNARSAINQTTVGVPVIAIGVPTVIDSRLFVDPEEKDAARSAGAMLVSPKEINEIASAAARIISGGINRAFGIYG